MNVSLISNFIKLTTSQQSSLSFDDEVYTYPTHQILTLYMTSGLVHFFHLDESFPSFVFIFTVFSIEISVCKQCRP